MTVLPFRKPISIPEAQDIIRKATNAGRVSWSKHGKKRMQERDITIMQVLNCLKKGKVIDNPFFVNKNGGGYETTVEKVVAGEWLKVVVCIKTNSRLLVITAIN